MENDKENCFFKLEDILSLKRELCIADKIIRRLKETNSVAQSNFDQHVQELNCQIDELWGKIKASNIKHTQDSENITNLQSTISSLELVSCLLFLNK